MRWSAASRIQLPPSVTEGLALLVAPQQRRAGSAERPQPRPRSSMRVAASPKGTTSIGSGNRPSVATHLLSSAMTIMRAEAAATIFSRNKRAAAALDQSEIGPDLVGAIDGQIKLRRLIQRGERNAQALGLRARRLGSRHADDLAAVPHALRQQIQEVLHGRAGAQPEPHSRLHEFAPRARRLLVSALRGPSRSGQAPHADASFYRASPRRIAEKARAAGHHVGSI